MPNARITNNIANSGLSNAIPNAGSRNAVPHVVAESVLPNAGIKPGSSTTNVISPPVTFGGFGYPIGILMAITDIQSHTTAGVTEIYSSDYKPNVRIFNY